MISKIKSSTPIQEGIFPVLPLRDIVVFPHMIVPLFVGREKSIRALEEVMRTDGQILLATQKSASEDEPNSTDIYDIGTLAQILQLLKLPDGTVKVLVEGRARAKVSKFNDREDFYEAEAAPVADIEGEAVEVSALMRSVVAEFENYVKLNKKISAEVVATVAQTPDASKLADTVASNLSIKIADKQALLETFKSARAPGGNFRRHGRRNIGAAGGNPHPHPRQASDGKDAARILSQRADEGDPERAGRRGEGRSCRT